MRFKKAGDGRNLKEEGKGGDTLQEHKDRLMEAEGKVVAIFRDEYPDITVLELVGMFNSLAWSIMATCGNTVAYQGGKGDNRGYA